MNSSHVQRCLSFCLTSLSFNYQVLKLWFERKTLSEYVIRHHIRVIEDINEASFGSSRRPSRTERALNDPLRDNEGMLVDEYGRYGISPVHGLEM
jgi:hypothetical protein